MKPCVLALGFFDGVHLGHAQLLKRVRQIADSMSITAAAITFDRHPASFLHGSNTPLINTVSERIELMKREYLIDEVYVLSFDEGLSTVPWKEFACMVQHTYGAKHIICGYDYRFGAGGEGTAEKLADFCEKNGIGFDVIDAVLLDGTTVSSTHIRKLLLQGKVQEAQLFLGHPHFISGTVVEGRKVGRTMGIPTANLCISSEILIPQKGVYAARAFIEGEAYPAVVNIGTRPTFCGKTITIEPWILDFDRDIYGKEISLALYSYIRDEQKFESKEALQAEILRNAHTVRELLKERGNI